MPETRNDELYRVLKHNGYPDDFCREIAYCQMNTDFTAPRYKPARRGRCR